MPAEHSQMLKVERLQVRFEGDESRVITRPFFPGGETRICAIIDRVISLSDPHVNGGPKGQRLAEVCGGPREAASLAELADW